MKHYFADVPQEAVQAHFNRRMVTFCTGISTSCRSVSKVAFLGQLVLIKKNATRFLVLMLSYANCLFQLWTLVLRAVTIV